MKLKYFMAIGFAIFTQAALAQENPQPYSELPNWMGNVLRYEPAPAAKKAATAAMNATPTEAAAVVAGGYVAYRTFGFVGKNPVLGGAAITLAYLVANPEVAHAHILDHPEDGQKLNNWLEKQKAQNPKQKTKVEAVQNKLGLPTNGQPVNVDNYRPLDYAQTNQPNQVVQNPYNQYPQNNVTQQQNINQQPQNPQYDGNNAQTREVPSFTPLDPNRRY